MLMCIGCVFVRTMWPDVKGGASFGRSVIKVVKYSNCIAIWRPALEWIQICVITCVSVRDSVNDKKEGETAQSKQKRKYAREIMWYLF